MQHEHSLKGICQLIFRIWAAAICLNRADKVRLRRSATEARRTMLTLEDGRRRTRTAIPIGPDPRWICSFFWLEGTLFGEVLFGTCFKDVTPRELGTILLTCTILITMKMFVTIVVFVFSLYSTGLSLSCIECTTDAATSCKGNVTTCIGAELCMSTITQTTAADGQKTFTFDRYCGDGAQCNTMGSLTSFLSTETNSTCCNKDLCTPPQPTLTKREASENSVQCQVCLAHSTTQCLPTNVRNCTGDEKYCAVYKIKSGAENTVIMGCASESFCRSAQNQKLVNGKNIRVVASCIRSGSDYLKAQVFYLLPFLLGVLVHGI